MSEEEKTIKVSNRRGDIATMHITEHGIEVASEWQPIETAPKDGSTFLTYTPYPDGEDLYDFAHWLKEYG